LDGHVLGGAKDGKAIDGYVVIVLECVPDAVVDGQLEGGSRILTFGGIILRRDGQILRNPEPPRLRGAGGRVLSSGSADQQQTRDRQEGQSKRQVIDAVF